MRSMYSVKQSWSINKPIISTLLIGVLMIFFLPLRWLFAAFVAASIHELGHCFTVLILGGSIHGLKIGQYGTIIEAADLTKRKEVICLLAGPLAGLLPILTLHTFPALAICSIVQTMYNLLPIYPLDGGKILRHIVIAFRGSDHLFHIIEHIAMFLIFLLCVYIQIRFRISLFVFVSILLLRKTPCKA